MSKKKSIRKTAHNPYTVKRQYTRKTGEVVSKVYRYGTPTIKMTSTGKVNKNSLKAVIKQGNLSDKIQTQADIKVFESNIVDYKLKGKNITYDYVISKFTNDTIRLMLANTGYTVQQIAEHLNVSVENLLKREPWNDDFTIFTDPVSGREFAFEFKSVYEDIAAFREIPKGSAA